MTSVKTVTQMQIIVKTLAYIVYTILITRACVPTHYILVSSYGDDGA